MGWRRTAYPCDKEYLAVDERSTYGAVIWRQAAKNGDHNLNFREFSYIRGGWQACEIKSGGPQWSANGGRTCPPGRPWKLRSVTWERADCVSVWYYRVGGKEIGPLKASEIVAHVRTGRVEPDTLVRKNDSQWVAAGEVAGLFDAADTDRSHQHVCPFCGVAVPPPPSTCPNCFRDVVVSYKGKWDSKQAVKAESDTVDAEERKERVLEELREQVRRREIIVYSICLVLWIALIVAAPFLHRMADDGQLGISRMTVSSILGAVGIVFAIAAFWFTRGG